MSRTTRHIPYWANRVNNYERTWLALSALGYSTWERNHDWRDRWDHGYDKHHATSPVRGSDGWKDTYSGKSRKDYKRLYARKQRIANKALIDAWLDEEWEAYQRLLEFCNYYG